MNRRSFFWGAVTLLTMSGMGACSQSRKNANSGDSPVLVPATYVSPAVTPMPGPSEQSSLWKSIATVSGLSMSLPATFVGPSEHDDWGFYTVSYDLNGRDSKPVQRVIVGSIGDKQTAVAARQEVRDVNNALIQGYIETNQQSWEQTGSLAVDRVSFYHGNPSQNLLGCSWMVAQEGKDVIAVTLFGAYVDDGLRNGIEKSLSFS